jgi:hypothetical protein
VYKNGSLLSQVTGLTLTDNSVTNGTTYFYAVSALNAIGESLTSPPVSATPSGTQPTAPPAPVITGTAGDKTAAAHWGTLVTGGSPITHLQPLLNGSAVDDFSDPNNINGGIATYTNLTNGTLYALSIKVINAVGSATSNVVNVTPVGAATAPSAPVLQLTAGNTQNTLTWNTPANGGSAITGYKLYRNTVALLTLGVVTTYTDTGLTNGTLYTYTITALNAVGESVQSAAVAGTPTGTQTVPGAPVLSGTVGDTFVNLTWTVPATGGAALTGYKIYRGGVLVTSTVPGTTYTDSGLTNGTAYTYTVSAVNSVGEGPLSNALVRTPVAATGSPTLPANQLVGQPSYRAISWGGANFVDVSQSEMDTWKGWGFYATSTAGIAGYIGQALSGSGQLPIDTPNHAGSQYQWQRAFEGYTVSGVNTSGPDSNVILGLGPFYRTKIHNDPTYESYLSVHPDTYPTGVSPVLHDWWDDTWWANTAAWFGMVARDLKNVLGGSGIGFDTESGAWGTLVAGHTWDQQNQQVFNRGYQCATAFWQNFPDGKVFTYDYRHSGGWQEYLSGFYNSGDTRTMRASGAQTYWHLGWVKAMCDFGSVNSRHMTMDAVFYVWGEYGYQAANGTDCRIARLKINCESGMSLMSQEYPYGVGQASWSKGGDRIRFIPASWPDGASDKTTMTSPATWAVQTAADREGSMGEWRCVYHGTESGSAGWPGGTPGGTFYSVYGNTSSAVWGMGTTHLAANQAAANPAALTGDTQVATCINLSWTGSTLTCRAAHKYGIWYVEVFNGAAFNPANPEASRLGLMQMSWGRPSWPEYVGAAGSAGGSPSNANMYTTGAMVADSYVDCTFPTSGAVGDWRVLKVMTAKMDTSWFKVQRTS